MVAQMLAPGRAAFLAHAENELQYSHRALCIGGQTTDQFSIESPETLRDALIARLRNKYEAIILYDATSCNVRIHGSKIQFERDEISMFERLCIADDPVLSAGDPEGTNIIRQLIDSSVVKPHSPYDQAFFRFAHSAIATKDLQACIVIEHASQMLGTNELGRMPAHEQTELNRARLLELQQDIRRQDGKSLILLDHGNQVHTDALGDIPQVNVPAPSLEELTPILPKSLRADTTAQTLARGSRINTLQNLVQRHQEPVDILQALRAHKTKEIEAQTDGLVLGLMPEIDPATIAISDAENKWWQNFSKKLQEGSALVPQGVLLLGPPGTGKTLRAQYLASMMGLPFLQVLDVGSQGLAGKKLEKFQKIFESAIANKPCVLYIDEIDKLLPKTEGNNGSSTADNDTAEVTAYLQSMIGSGHLDGVVILGGCNNVERMNEAMIRSGRFGARAAILPPKTDIDRLQLLRAVYTQVPELDGLLTEAELAYIAHNSEGATGADYVQLLKLAGLNYGISGGQFIDSIQLYLPTCPPKRNPEFYQMEETAIAQATIHFEPLKKDGLPPSASSITFDAMALLAQERSRLEQKEKDLAATTNSTKLVQSKVTAELKKVKATLKRLQNERNEISKTVDGLVQEKIAAIDEAFQQQLVVLKEAEQKLQQVIDAAAHKAFVADESTHKSAAAEVKLTAALKEVQTMLNVVQDAVSAASNDTTLETIAQCIVNDAVQIAPVKSSYAPMDHYLQQCNIVLPKEVLNEPLRSVLRTASNVRWTHSSKLDVTEGLNHILLERNLTGSVPVDSIIIATIAPLQERESGCMRQEEHLTGRPLPFYVHGMYDGKLVCSHNGGEAFMAEHFTLHAVIPWEQHQGTVECQVGYTTKILDGTAENIHEVPYPKKGKAGYPFASIPTYDSSGFDVDISSMSPEAFKKNWVEAKCKRPKKAAEISTADIFTGDVFTEVTDGGDGEWFCEGFIKGDMLAIQIAGYNKGCVYRFRQHELERQEYEVTKRWGTFDPSVVVAEDFATNPYRVFLGQCTSNNRKSRLRRW